VSEAVQDRPIDEAIMRKDRIKFGIGNVLFQSEETGVGGIGIPAMIIRMLGGSDQHIGLYGATQGVTSFSQIFGAVILKRTRSDKKGMVVAMFIGFVVAVLVAASIAAFYFNVFSKVSLYLYLVFAVCFFAVGGFQSNIENSWIGDLVPAKRLGWFTSYKWIVGTAGVVLFNLLIGRLVDANPSPAGYAAVYLMFGVSFCVAAWVYSSVTDRTPQTINFIKTGPMHHERLQYRSFPLWCYIVFYWCWSGGRAVLYTFCYIYLIDQFHFSMTKIAWLVNAQCAMSCVIIYILGRISDTTGHRVPLMIISGIVACCMSLWVFSAWFGIVPVIVYMFINGAAGNTHWMLASNLALEIFPEKGRAAYLGFSRFIIGCCTMTTPILAGQFMQHLSGFHMQLWGADINRYHILFSICMLISMCCIVPLFVLGNRKVEGSGLVR